MTIVPDQLVFVGTYTTGASKGIYVYRLDGAKGALELINVAPDIVNPSYLDVHPTGRFLYAVNENEEGEVSAFSIDITSGRLELLNRSSAHGSDPCHISIDPSGSCALIANYGSGNICAYAIGTDGRLSEVRTNIQHHGNSVNPIEKKTPHAHSINIDPSNRFAFATDLGLDQVLVYNLDASACKLVLHDPPFFKVAGGQGPRHFDFHPSGPYAYLINEMGNTITAFSYDVEHGSLCEIHTVSTLPLDFYGTSNCADIHVHPSGKFVYGSNRGHDSICVTRIDPNSGGLTVLEFPSSGGGNPRNFAIDPSGTYLFAANSTTENIVTFRIDSKSGGLEPISYVADTPNPVCIKMIPL